MKNTFAFEHKDFKELIDWFWQEWSRKKHRVNKDGLCQCESESLIRHSNDPNKMRAFLMISVFIDRFFYTHYSNYENFRSKFEIPKLHSHPTAGYHPADWFCYGIRGSKVSIDWTDVEKIVSIAINDIRKSEIMSKGFFSETRVMLPGEIRMDFNSYGEITECGKNFKKILLKYW